MAERRAEVVWEGDLLGGSGNITSSGSGAVDDLGVTWRARTEAQNGQTSPEELIAAAHASCFSMALSGGLAKAGHEPKSLSTTATVTFVPGTGITRSVIDVAGVVPGIDETEFRQAAEQAKENCPVSKALKGNVELQVSARLQS